MRFGRQTGKSVAIAAAAVRWALLNPGSTVFIVGPTSIQVRQIYMHSGLIEKMIPPEYCTSIHKTDARYNIGDSVIRLYGADNEDSLRGLTASLVLVDELKDLSRELIDSIIKPALLVRGAPLVLSGTPPSVASHFYWDYVNEAETSGEWESFRATSYDNIYTPQGSVDAERKLHESRGTLDVFRREYLAEFCVDSHKSIFPMLSREKHVIPYSDAIRMLRSDLGHWRFWCSADPGSTFAVLCTAINEYTKKVIVYDMVYEKGQHNTSVGQLVPKVFEKLNQVAPSRFLDDPPTWVVDEAALWFRNELRDRFDINAWASRKAQNQKLEGLSLIKDMLNEGRLIMTDRCEALYQEMENYQLGENGLPVKRGDHACDALRYNLGVANYSQRVEDEPLPVAELAPGLRDDPRRAWTPEQEFGDPLDFGDESHLSLDLVE